MTAVFSLLEISPHAHTQILHDWQASCALLMLNCGTAGSLLGLEKIYPETNGNRSINSSGLWFRLVKHQQ